MKVIFITIALVGCGFSMPVGVEQDNPRPVVPLVITDYSSVANKNVAEEAPADAPKETVAAADDTRKEEEVKLTDDKPELAPTVPEADSKPEGVDPIAETKPLLDTPVAVAGNPESAAKPQEPASDVQEFVSSEIKPAEGVQNVPGSEEKVIEESVVKSDIPVKEEVKSDEPVPVAASETSEVKSDAPVNAELADSQKVAKPVEEKVNDETKTSDVVAPVVSNVPDVSHDTAAEKAEESVESKPVADDVKEVKVEESAEKKIQTEDVKTEDKKESAPAEIVPDVPVQDPVVEDKPVKDVKPVVPEAVKEDEPVKDEKVDTPVNRRRRETAEKKEDEKKKKDDEKKTKAEDTVKTAEINADAVQDESVSASENNPVKVPTPVQDIPENVDATKLKDSEKVEAEKTPDSTETVKDEVTDSAPVAAVSDKVEEPVKVEENKNVESSEEKKLATPINEEIPEEIKVAETQVAPESVQKEADKPEEIKKEDVASVDETKKDSNEEKVLSDPIPEEKVQEATPVSLNTEEKKPEPVAADEKPDEKPVIKEENVPVSS